MIVLFKKIGGIKMEKKIKFKVFNKSGEDVTDTRDWYIDQNGDLYFETNDIDSPLYFIEDFTYEIVID